MSRKSFILSLKSSKMLASHVKHLVFTLIEEESLSYIAGQFVTLHVPAEGKTLRRSYSIANHPGSRDIELAASYVPGGVASEFLFNMQPTSEVVATGPFGRLVLCDPGYDRIILVATGTGVTPYRAMLPDLERRFQENPHSEVILLFGVRKPEDLLYRDEFVAFSQKNPSFQFRAYYSRSSVQPSFPYEFQGYVSSAFCDMVLSPKTDVVYLCGNPNMVDEVFALLLERGLPNHNVRREKYISSLS